jgi:predicted O-methyltransferase YrrM
LWRWAGLAIDNGAVQKQYELARLFQVVEQSRPRCLLEVGVSCGGTFAMWGRVCDSLERIVGLDLVKPANLQACVAADRRARILIADSHTDEAERCVHDALPEGIDFLLIDGDHSYAGVKADFERYSPLVNDGGTIAIHDILPDFFHRYGKRTAACGGEVYRFWNEIREQYHGEAMVDDPDQDAFGVGLIRWKR